METERTRKKEIQKHKSVRVNFRDPSRKVNHLNMITGDIKITTEFTSSISSTRIDYSILKMIKSPKTNKLPDGLIEKTSSMVDDIASKSCIYMKKVINRGKRSKILNEVKSKT